jgi:hypothetical protein
MPFYHQEMEIAHKPCTVGGAQNPSAEIMSSTFLANRSHKPMKTSWIHAKLVWRSEPLPFGKLEIDQKTTQQNHHSNPDTLSDRSK